MSGILGEKNLAINFNSHTEPESQSESITAIINHFEKWQTHKHKDRASMLIKFLFSRCSKILSLIFNFSINHDWGHFITQSTIILTRIMFLCLCGYLALVLPSNRNQTSHSPFLWLSLETSTAPTQFLENIFFLKETFSAAAIHVHCHKPIQMGQRGQYFMTRRCPCVEISLELKKMTLQNPPFIKKSAHMF